MRFRVRAQKPKPAPVLAGIYFANSHKLDRSRFSSEVEVDAGVVTALPQTVNGAKAPETTGVKV